MNVHILKVTVFFFIIADAQKSEGVKKIRTNKAKTSDKKKDRNTHVSKYKAW